MNTSSPSDLVYKEYVRRQLDALRPVFARAALGDLSPAIDIPANDDEFAELFAGIEILLEVARRRLGELEEQNLRFQAIISAMGEGLMVVDPDYKIVLLNPAGARLLGVSVAAALGQDIRQLITSYHGEKETPASERPISKVLEEGHQVSVELKEELYWRTGSRAAFPVVLVTTPLKDQQKVIGAVEIFHDVTEEKRVDQAKNEFISLASHQLRTPLSAIRWANERLLTRATANLTLQQKEYLERIERGGTRMAELIAALLNISRLELGKLAIAREKIDVAQLVTNALSDLTQMISRKQLQVATDYPPRSELMTDPRLLRTVVENLLVNAIKFTPEGGHIIVQVQIKGQELVISVTDTGPGIPRQQQGQVFRRFFRAGNVADQAGTGLGLHLAKTITERLGGKIWFTSAENQGSTFSLSFPYPS